MFACVLFSHVNRAIIHVDESINSEGLCLLAGDDGHAFQGKVRDGKREREGQMDEKEDWNRVVNDTNLYFFLLACRFEI